MKIEESLANVYKRFPRLEERRNQMAGTLSGGEQQMLAMGRALMSKPKIILMDEPSMGLSPIFVNEIFDIIQAVSESGTTVLLVETEMQRKLFLSQIAPMFLRLVRSQCQEMQKTCWKMKQLRKHI
mgnify:CR=1 FL=1